MKKLVAVAMTLALVLTILLAHTASTAPDPQVLVGTWQGEISTQGGRPWSSRSSRERTLTIRSVEQDGSGEWLVDAQYGVTGGGRSGKIDAKLKVGDSIQIQFLEPWGAGSGRSAEIKAGLSKEPPWILKGTLTSTDIFLLELRKVEKNTSKVN